MRSLSSAFSIGRGGRSDSASSRSINSQNPPPSAQRLNKARSTSLFAKAPKTPLETTSNSCSHQDLTGTPNSSASSDGSASLRTPEDETVMMHFLPKTEDKKRWPNWLTWRKPSDKSIHDTTDIMPSTSQTTVTVSKPDHNNLNQQQQRNANRSESDTDDEDLSSDDSDSHVTATGFVHRTISTHTHVPSHQARSNLRILLRNSLTVPPSPPPLVEIPSAQLFPRSITNVNAQHSKGRPRSFEANMLIYNLLKRLDRGDLTLPEAQSISYFTNRSQPQPKPALRRVGPVLEKKAEEDVMSYASMRVGKYSRGLRKWANRPCFEQRFSVWQPDDYGKIICRSVMGVGRGLAVLDLEFSEGLVALAGLDLDDETFERELSLSPSVPKKPTQVPTSQRSTSQPRSQASSRKASLRSSSSPLHVEHASLAEPILSAVSSISSIAPELPASKPVLDTKQTILSQDANGSVPGTNLAQRGVRFAESTKSNDDDVPLGYTLRAKKQKEEKERFLQAEREKRTKDRVIVRQNPENSRQAKANDLRVLEEQKRAEEARRRAEEEKRLREERVRAKYNEEVAASRRRRESARLGMDNYTNIRELHQIERGPTYARPAYDESVPPISTSRRQNSDYLSPGNRPSTNLRPPGNVESGDRNRGLSLSSVRGSMYGSSEDIRQTNSSRRRSTISEQSDHASQRPASVVSTSSRRQSLSRAQSTPMQIPMQMPMMPYAVPIVPMIPPVPPIPAIPIWNMPLLPPNAPFMMQSYSRSPSPGSGGSSPHSRNSSPSRHHNMPHSRSQQSLNNSGPPSTGSRHSRHGSGEVSLPHQHSASPLNIHSSPITGDSRRPLRSASYSPMQSSSLSAQVPSRNDNYRQSTNTSSNPRLPDSKRRTTML